MRLRSLLLPAFLVAAFAPIALAEFEVPPNDNYVTQLIQMISPEQEEELETKLAQYEKDTSNQIAILLVDTMSGASLVDAAVETGRAWGVGTKEHNNGVLLMIAVRDREATMQIGYGLEGALPDIVVGGILQEDLKPNLMEAKYYEGLLATIDAIEKRAAGEYTADRYNESTGFPGGTLLLFIVLIAGQFFASVFAKSRSWWAGGVVGGVAGLILAFFWNWWLSIPFLVIVGLVLDYVVSSNPNLMRSRRGRGTWGGGGGFGGGGSGGGFGGFGGGSFGGGGGSMKW